ncbi:hypothetical protein [Portibacter marinus]|uniref:hypothetical protein n=1 Tax=Portibacter marinus TaxID=2898660 RepID=UPI001F3E1AB3|nr:hypothetical protein [Portibacter marinus]
MKNLYLFSLMLLFFSCEKQICIIGENMASCALEDGEEWFAEEASFRFLSAHKKNISIRITSHNFMKEFNFTNIPFQLGDHKLEYDKDLQEKNAKPYARLACIDYDAVFCSYGLDTTAIPAFITIDEISSDSAIIRGTFEMSFKLEYNAHPSLQEFTTYEQGTFFASLVQ